MTNILPYSLPDISLLQKEKTNHFLTWTPKKTYIILGASNKPEDNIHYDSAIKDGVVIQKRSSGGETVLLSPKTIVIALLSDYNNKKPLDVFKEINTKIIKSLYRCGIKNITNNGISDLCINGKKILGSSLYKKKKYYFYHAVLNISEDTKLIAKYIKHPKREPEYRRSRNHEDFITSLYHEGYEINIDEFNSYLNK